jgi:acetaldehyde dehydrogenase/alcohol dehydrogenase
MVHAAYSSGTPAIGVGAGNTPVVIDETADLTRAVASILMSKTFDNGVICASEQAVIAVDAIYDSIRDRFSRHGGYILNKKRPRRCAPSFWSTAAVNAKIVGQAAPKIAAMAGISVPATTKVLIGEVTEPAEDEPFAHEKLSTILALYRAKDFKDAVGIAGKLVALGGIGHTSVLYTDQDQQKERVNYFGEQMKTSRILINTPSSHGGIGDLVQFQPVAQPDAGLRKLGRKLSVGECGSEALAEQEDRGQARGKHVVAQAARVRFYFRRGCTPEALKDIAGKKRALIVTDDYLFRNGMPTT